MKETKEGNVTAREKENVRMRYARKEKQKKIIIIKEERHVRRKKGGWNVYSV